MTPAPADRSALAAELFEAADADPVDVLHRADALVEEAEAEGDWAFLISVLRVGGKAARLDSDLTGSLERLDRAVRLADELGSLALGAQARVTRSASRALAGDPAGALADLDDAMSSLEPPTRAVALAQRAGVLAYLGHAGEVVNEAFAAATDALRAHGDWPVLAGTYTNWGIHLVQQGDAAAGTRHLEDALASYRLAGSGDGEASALQNLGFAAASRGDVLAALRLYDQARRKFAPLHVEVGSLDVDEAEALLMVGLASRARDLAAAAKDRLIARGSWGEAADAVLVGAIAALQAGDDEAACAAAGEAARAFQQGGRSAKAAWGDVIALTAAERIGGASEEELRHQRARAMELVKVLSEARHHRKAVFAQLVAARLGARLHDAPEAARLLDTVSGSSALGAPDVRLAYLTARAIVMAQLGHRDAALDSARTGLEVAERYRDILGALELRAHVAGLVTELSEIILCDAVRSGDPARIWQAADAVRARALRYPPAVAVDDEELASTLSELRAVTGQLDGDDAADRTTLERRRSVLEHHAAAISSRRSWSAVALNDPSIEDTITALEGWALVEYLELDDVALAVVVGQDGLRLVDLGPIADASDEAKLVRSRLAHLAAGGWLGGSAANLRQLQAALSELDALLVAPLDLPAAPGVAVVPSGHLLGVPWGALPSLAGTPVVVSPAAALATRRPVRPLDASERILVVAGPDLAQAADEVDAVAAAYIAAHRWPRRLTGDDATVTRVLGGLAWSDVVHVVAHGTLLAENPLFSQLKLADGALFVHELQRHGQLPRVVVLSACDSARVTVQPGGEILGFAAVLLAAGVRHLVAAVGPVADVPATVALMRALHERVAAGASPPAALVEARSCGVGADDVVAVATAAMFCCYGTVA